MAVDRSNAPHIGQVGMQIHSSPPLHRPIHPMQRPGASLGLTIDSQTLRRALRIVPLAITAYVLLWFCFFESPHQPSSGPVPGTTSSQASR